MSGVNDTPSIVNKTAPAPAPAPAPAQVIHIEKPIGPPLNSIPTEQMLRYAYTGSGYWGGSWYPYWSLMLITVLGGFFGLDHFYLRSPSTGFLKFILNIFTFGAWWIYDIIQIFKDKESVLESGLNIPIVGAAGIAAGVFTDRPGGGSKDVKSPIMFLLYLAVTIWPYTLGLDSFVAGDVYGGVFKFLSLIAFPMLPFVLIQKCLELYRFFATPSVFFEKGLPRLPGISFLLGDWGCHNLGPEDLKDGCPGGLLGFMLNLLPLTTNSIDVAISAPIDAVSAVVKTAEIAADSTGKIISAATGQAVPIIATASMLVQKGPEAINKAVNVAATVEKDLNKYTKPSVIQDLAVKQGVMTGGASNNSPLLEGALILIISLILGGGLYQGGLRIKELIKQNNGGAKRDDRPVEPRGF
jgi:hypothetical protein